MCGNDAYKTISGSQIVGHKIELKSCGRDSPRDANLKVADFKKEIEMDHFPIRITRTVSFRGFEGSFWGSYVLNEPFSNMCYFESAEIFVDNF